MAITAGMVKDLREKTGLPMMECKKALDEAGGDEQQAIELLRKKGLVQLSKRAGRETGEGRLTCYLDEASGRAAIVELLCETAPVAGTEDFIELSAAAARAATQIEAPTAENILEQPLPSEPARKVGDLLNDAVNRIRENIKIGRVGVLSGHIGHYLHHDGRKGVLVEFNAACPAELATGVCMHVAAMRPMCVRRDEVDPKLVEQEREIAAEQVQGKPEHILDKIVTGKLNKWYSEIVLLEQPFVKEDKKSVGQILQEAGPELTVNRYVRFEIGEA
ncbi:MAG: translation elongation factor Ts [Phycisphaerae bacterium]|nr:translation elongation factor Ts [Phycisphaerae bacterium]